MRVASGLNFFTAYSFLTAMAQKINTMFLQLYGFFIIYVFGVWALLRQVLETCAAPSERLSFGKQDGKIFIVTGGIRGIGRSVVERLLNLGAFVIITSRSCARTVAESLEKLETISSRFRYVQLELHSMADVAKFCEMINNDYKHIDGLVCNAGSIHVVNRQMTCENLEPQQTVNYFSNVLMVENLRPLLRGNHSRVVLVSSAVQRLGYCNLDDFMFRKSYSAHLGYVQSKLCQVAYARYRGRSLLEEGITINAVHPGVVASSLYNKFIGFIGSFIFLSPESGAEAVVHALLSITLANVSGQYMERYEVLPPGKKVLDSQFQRDLYEFTISHLQPWLTTA